MRAFNVRLVRLAVAAGAIAGSALVSSVAQAADETPSTEPPSVTTSDVASVTEVIAVDPAAEVIVVDPPSDALFEDIAVIEIVVPKAEGVEPDPSNTASSADELTTVASSAPAPALAMETSEPGPSETDEHGSDHQGSSGGQGGQSGSGNPFRMTFTVEWHDSDGKQITEFDVMVPPELLAEFELLATSRTGKGNNETSATCTYPDGEPVLRCIYEGHGKSGSEALIIPAKKEAFYTVSVAWPVTGWTVSGADPEQEYKARKTCGVESGGDHGTGGGHEPGSEPEAAGLEGNGDDSDGHGSGGQGSGGHGGGGVSCVHTVVMRQVASLPPAPPPPAPEPPAAPPTQESGVVPPGVTPPATPTAPEMQSFAAAPRSLPATGGSVSLILLIGGVLITMGSALAGLTRRAS